MGKELFAAFPELVAEADAVLGYSIVELCVRDPERRLNQTRYTQPALYVVNILHYLNALRGGAVRPSFLAGHSLGEYCALYAAGAFDFGAGLRLVQERGRLMSQASGGAMAAILNVPTETVLGVLRDRGGQTEAANFNTPTQTVLSGPAEELVLMQPLLEAQGATVVHLNVSAAFHSSFMCGASAQFAPFLDQVGLSDSGLPVISNVHALPYAAGQIKANLVAQMHSPVRWTETVRYLLGRGARDFVEFGPKPVLSRLIAEIDGADADRAAPAAPLAAGAA